MDAFEQGFALFNAQQYFEAHEAWEELWIEAQGAERSMLQGLIQVAAALHHAQNGNFNGCRKLFASAMQYLAKGETEAKRFDLPHLRDRILEFLLAVDTLSDEPTPLPYFSIDLK